MRKFSIYLLVFIGCTTSAALAADADAPTVVMTGNGSVSASPDQAQVSAGVVAQAKTADAAVAKNRNIINRVFDVLRQMGISRQAIQTTGFSLEPIYPPEDVKHPQPHEVIAYEVSNGIDVKLDDVTRAGAVLDALISAGANQSAGVVFSIKNPQPLLREARVQAAKDALNRAQTYSSAVDATLGSVLSIREGYSYHPTNGLETVTVTSAKASTPIEAGEQTVEATVTITWSLK